MKKALLVLVATGMLFSSGCLGGWQWWLGLSQFGKNVTDILDNIGVLTG
jgi:hypothetical protein